MCSFNHRQQTLTFAGARQNMLMINGSTDLIKGSRRSIGGCAEQLAISFHEHTISYHSNDWVYFWTDGLKDPFGGEHKKKLSISRLIEFIQESSNLRLAEQKSDIDKKLQSWMKHHDQMDDMLLVRLRM